MEGSFRMPFSALFFGRLLTTQSNVHKLFLALKRFPPYFSFEC